MTVRIPLCANQIVKLLTCLLVMEEGVEAPLPAAIHSPTIPYGISEMDFRSSLSLDAGEFLVGPFCEAQLRENVGSSWNGRCPETPLTKCVQGMLTSSMLQQSKEESDVSVKMDMLVMVLLMELDVCRVSFFHRIRVSASYFLYLWFGPFCSHKWIFWTLSIYTASFFNLVHLCTRHFLMVDVFLLACTKDGKEAYGSDCNIKRQDQRKFVIIAGT